MTLRVLRFPTITQDYWLLGQSGTTFSALPSYIFANVRPYQFVSLPVAAGANSANYNLAADWNGQNGNVTTVGSNGGPSAYGTFDQSGNTEEWIGAYGGSSRNDPSLSVMRGGSFLSNEEGGTYPMNLVWFSNEVTPTNRFSNVGFRVASPSDANGYGGFVTVGNAGNANNASGYGGVSYGYKIGRYSVTNAEYKAFLNAVASTDTNGLYDPLMGTDARGGITRSGSSGSYTYTTRGNMCAKPVNFVTPHACYRFCNWLHNGKPTGPQSSVTTEDGAYTITASNVLLPANGGAKYRLPTEHEYVKAAYHKSGGRDTGYWAYATQSNAAPAAVAADATGNGPVATAYTCTEDTVIITTSLWKAETLRPSYHWSM
jgi:formylglycine-generating enzyme required for sulfatase activity